MIKKIKNFFIFFCCFVTLIGAEREIPHSIVTENPKKEVAEIQTLKKYKEKAELNITVTKIKTEELPVLVDRNRKKIFTKLENVEGGEIQVVEKPENIPNPETVEGRRALNKNSYRRVKRSVSDSNLETERYDITAGEKRTKLEISYRTLPKDLYIAVTDKNNQKLKKLYKANYTDYKGIYDKTVNVKLWFFGEEMGSLSNVILDYTNNSTGDIQLRSNGQFGFPEDAVTKSGLHTVFDMDKELVNEEFEDSDTVKIENKNGEVSGIRDNQGSFYKDRNKYGELTIPGFKVKARIWSNSPKLELSLQKNGNNDGYASFDIVHKDSNGRTRQTIHVEVFINNKTFEDYFKTETIIHREQIKIHSSNQTIEKWHVIHNPGVKVKKFYTDDLKLEINKNAKVERKFGEQEGVEYFDFNQGGAIKYYPTSIPTPVANIADCDIKKIDVYMKNEWLMKKSKTFQIFTLEDALQFKYGKEKRSIPISLYLGFYTSDWRESDQVIEGTIKGLPIIGEPLTKDMFNGENVIDFKNNNAYKLNRNIKSKIIKCFKLKLTDKTELYYNTQDLNGKEFVDQGVKFKFIYKGISEDGDYKYYYLGIQKMELKSYDRNLEIKGISVFKNEKLNAMTDKIKIPKFSPKNLINESNTSLKGEIVRYVDISSDITSNYLINLGEFHFKYYQDMTVLRSNMSKSPYIELPQTAYLKLEGNTNVTIPVILSFDRNSDGKKLEMDNFNNGGKTGGGNGKAVYLKISPENYKKLKEQGGGKTYNLKADIEVKSNIDKSPLDGNAIGKQDDDLKASVTIKTLEVKSDKATIEFVDKKPLYKDGFFKFLDKSIIPQSTEIKGTVYANTVKLVGEVPELKEKGKMHKYELIDANSNIFRGTIGSGGSGGYWEDVNIGKRSKATISQGKERATYIALKGWDYSGSNGTVSIKHFNEKEENVSQYYVFKFIVPKFDPYIYYNENGNNRIKKFEKKEVNFPLSKEGEKILIGEIATQDYNMEITKDTDDREGLRIEGNMSVDILNADSKTSTGKKAKIILEGIDVQINKISGQNKNAKIYIELPSDLDKSEEYIVKSSYTSENDISEKEGYILKIGRKGYFKELIKEIKIGGKQGIAKGSATINITTDYNLKDSGILKPLKDPSTEKLSFETQVTGMTLSDEQGSGFIELNPTDKLKISVGNGTSVEISKDKAKEISLTKNKMKVEIKDNKVHISFPVIELGESKENRFDLKVIDSTGKEKGKYTFKVVFPKNYLRIISVENMDFGRTAPSTSGYKTTGRVHIETTVTMEKLKVTKDKTEVEMLKVNSPNNKLVAKMVSETLEKEGVKSNGKYKYELTGELDVPRNTSFGEYNGILEITVSIKG